MIDLQMFADSIDLSGYAPKALLENYAPKNHTQTSETITTMAGYSKPNETGAITPNDTLNEAIGKLEAALGTTAINKAEVGYNVPTTSGLGNIWIEG